MISYFTKAGDLEVGAIFGPYRQSFSQLLENKLEGRKYGDGLNLILIQYHLEGKFLQTYPQMFKVLPYRKKEQAISVVVPVSQSFAGMSDLEKRQFIIKTTIDATKLVQTKMTRLKFKIDFDQLFKDIDECAREYLELSIFN